MKWEDITSAASHYGLIPLGVTREEGHFIVLLGPDEPRFWGIFKHSPEYQDGTPDPIDRYSTRVIGALGQTLNGEVRFPFGGPPYAPFYTWAVASGQFYASPIHFLVHAERGLFASFRGALVFEEDIEGPEGQPSPCLTCAAPCQNACPVGAFDSNGYAAERCKSHIAEEDCADCMGLGCAARRACPVAQGDRVPEQAAHHMTYFLR